jgi:hypothetical protein
MRTACSSFVGWGGCEESPLIGIVRKPNPGPFSEPQQSYPRPPATPLYYYILRTWDGSGLAAKCFSQISGWCRFDGRHEKSWKHSSLFKIGKAAKGAISNEKQ